MAIIKVTSEEIRKKKFAKERLIELEEASKHPIIFDEDCPEITPDLIGTRFIRVDRNKSKSVI